MIEDESSWQSWVTETAELLGWWWVHFRPGRTASGWRTPVAGQAAGYVDLTLVRDRVIFAELKTQTGRLTRPEVAWRARLIAAGAEVYVWRPADRLEITATLTRRK